MFIVVGAWLAALYLLVKDGLPWLEAHRSGRIRTRSHKREWVERAVDPIRFKALSRQRFQGLGAGLIAFMIGVIWILKDVVLVTLGMFATAGQA